MASAAAVERRESYLGDSWYMAIRAPGHSASCVDGNTRRRLGRALNGAAGLWRMCLTCFLMPGMSRWTQDRLILYILSVSVDVRH
jgi:hypothetical protein